MSEKNRRLVALRREPIAQTDLLFAAALFQSLAETERRFRALCEDLAARLEGCAQREPGDRTVALGSLELGYASCRVLLIDGRPVYRFGDNPGPILPGKPIYP